jgi:protein subunit release factor B
MREHLISVTKKDLIFQTFRCSGPGGQKINKTSSGVRIIHKDSGAVTESREERSQSQNKKIAFKRLTQHPKFKLWLNQVSYEKMSGKTIEERVKEHMKPENLKIETKDEDNKWIELIDITGSSGITIV